MTGEQEPQWTPTPMTENRLADQTSPYLLQHKDNPVHWQPWNEDTLKAAKETGKPILLSVGYAACHWCHVMAHESFENAETASVMNGLFVNIKVDREERPDIDLIYQNALQMMGENGGWPLTMFLTPDGDPFWGGTYFPNDTRYGRPGFMDVLHQIHRIYTDQPDKVAKNADALKSGLQSLSAPTPTAPLSTNTLDQTAQMIMRLVDHQTGGTQGAPKFPQVPLFKNLWRAYARSGNPQYANAVRLTLDGICQGGIYDHLGGGFARYSTDEKWLAPHFEKMLYDNALLIDLMCDVWIETNSALYQARIRETIEWLRRDMTVSSNGFAAFASAYDADSEGEEGKFYVWSADTIDHLLETDAPVFKEHYDVRPTGNWEGKTILNRSARPERQPPVVEGVLAACRDKLHAHRSTRVPPLWDDKVLADWNGLTIIALAKAGVLFDNADWIRAAISAFDFIRTALARDKSGRLYHAWRAGKAAHVAVLDDYAALTNAALALFEATADWAYVIQAETWAAIVEADHRDLDNGGYFLSGCDTKDVITRTKTANDNATPSGNGQMIAALARLYHLTGNSKYRDNADAAIMAFASSDARLLPGLCGVLDGFDMLENAIQIAVVGDFALPDDQAFLSQARKMAGPNTIVVPVRVDTYTGDHPLAERIAINDQPTAYVCQRGTCGLPISDISALRKQLTDR